MLATEFRVRVSNHGQIAPARASVQFLQRPVISRLILELRHARLRLFRIWIALRPDVAEDDRLGRAGRLAGGSYLAVPHVAALFFGLDLGVHDALDAERAFLHHAARSDGDFRIARHFQTRRVPIAVQQIIEAAHFPGAVVRTVAGADAAVVHLYVQTLGVVDRGVHRANDLAGRVLAMLAHHRLEIDLRV